MVNKIKNFLFPKKINGKEWINNTMAKKYGENWLDCAFDGLRNSDIRKDLRKTLKL